MTKLRDENKNENEMGQKHEKTYQFFVGNCRWKYLKKQIFPIFYERVGPKTRENCPILGHPISVCFFFGGGGGVVIVRNDVKGVSSLNFIIILIFMPHGINAVFTFNVCPTKYEL